MVIHVITTSKKLIWNAYLYTIKNARSGHGRTLQNPVFQGFAGKLPPLSALFTLEKMKSRVVSPTLKPRKSAKPQPPSLRLTGLIDHYAQALPAGSTYRRQAGQFLRYCLDSELEVSGVTFQRYSEGKSQTHKSAIRHFLIWYQQQGSPAFVADPPRRQPVPFAQKLLSFYGEYKTRIRAITKESYLKAIRAYFLYLEDQKKPVNFSALRAALVESYMAHLEAKKRSPFTRNLYLAAIKSLARFCLDKRTRLKINADQAEDLMSVLTVKMQTLSRGHYKDSLSREQRAALLDAARTPRERAILSLLAYEGLRTIEICRLEVGDLDLTGKELWTQSKGKADKSYIVLFDTCIPALVDYLQSIDCWPLASLSSESRKAYLFPRESDPSKPMETSQVRYIVDTALRRVGLKRRKVSAHSLRHTVAELLLDEGHPLELVQRHLRHQHIDTTQVYTGKKSDAIYKDSFKALTANPTP